MVRSKDFRTLLVALGVDNFGSGMFLPLIMVYITRVAGVPLGTAGVVVAAASVLGLAVPAAASRMVDRTGPRVLVVVSQLVQAAGMLAYLVAGGVLPTALGALLSVAGLQLFYSCLSMLVVDVVGEGPKDHPFALVTRVRGASFGLGALTGGVLASLGDAGWMRAGVTFNVVTFLVAAVVLLLRVHPVAPASHTRPVEPAPASALRSRPFLGLMAVAFLTTLPTDFLLGGNAVYLTDYLGVDAWLIGFGVALLTAFSATLGTTAVRLTNRFARTTTEASGVVVLLLWAVVSGLAIYVPGSLRTPLVLVLAVIVAVANVIPMARLAAMAEATAPEPQKGRFLAMFQYPFSVAQVVGPLLASLLAVAAWLPWVVMSVGLVVALAVLGWLRTTLPREAVFVAEARRCRSARP